MTWFSSLTEPQAIIIGFLITAVVGPIVVLLFTRIFNIKLFKADYGGKLQEMVDKSINQTNTALDELAAERDARKSESQDWEKKYSALESRLKDVEHMQAGPYSLQTTTEFMTGPDPKVIRQTHILKLVRLQDVNQ